MDKTMNMQRGKPGRTAAQSGQIGPTVGLKSTLLDGIATPHDLRLHDRKHLSEICDALRTEVIDIVSETGGHLGAGLGVV